MNLQHESDSDFSQCQFVPRNGRPDKLPPELIDLILSRVDSWTLHECALVCHAWLDPSRHYLFSKVIVVYSNYSDQFFMEFNLFVRTHQHVAVHIRDVELCGCSGRRYRGPTGCVNPKALVALAKRLPRLRRLKLVHVLLTPGTAQGSETPGDVKEVPAVDDFWQRLEHPLRISELSLTSEDSGEGDWLAALFQIVSSFETERLLRIELPDEDVYSSTSGVSAFKTHILRIGPLRHRGLCLTNIHEGRWPSLSPIEWLVPGQLTHLHLGFQGLCHSTDISQFMLAHGPHIVEFTISFGDALPLLIRDEGRRHPQVNESYWVGYRFDVMGNLAKLRFDFVELADRCGVWGRDWDQCEARRAYREAIVAFLACFPANLPLQRGVEIDFEPARGSPERMLGHVTPWEWEIEAALLRFENIARVCLDLGYNNNFRRSGGRNFDKDQTDENNIKLCEATFPELHRKKLLTFRFNYGRCCS